MQKLADIAVIAAIVVLVATVAAGLFVDLDGLTGTPKVIYGASLGYAIIVYLIAMLYCLGGALDMPKSTEKNLWIIGILFATVVSVPYFYFTRARTGKRKQAEPCRADNGG